MSIVSASVAVIIADVQGGWGGVISLSPLLITTTGAHYADVVWSCSAKKK